MTKNYFRRFVWSFLALLGVTVSALAVKGVVGNSLQADDGSSWKDIKADFTNGAFITSEETSNVTVGLKMNEDGTYTRVAADAADANAVITGKFHSNEHGLQNFSATVAVEGTVKITIGACGWGKDVIVKDATGATVATVNTMITANTDCYHNDKENNVVSTYYKVDQATTLTISGGGYVPYFAVEAVDADDIPNDAKVTFDVSDTGAQGVAPAEQEVEIGGKLTIPTNTSLYVEGKTLTAWTDGTNNYTIGQEVTVNEDITLTPVFTDNAVSFEERTAEVTATWDFQRKNGAVAQGLQNNSGLVVTQIAIGDASIDLPLYIDATSGKYANANWTDWAQVNDGTKFTAPACKGATFSTFSMNDNSATTFNGETGVYENNVNTYTYQGSSSQMEIVIAGGATYYRTVTAVYPVEEVSSWKDIKADFTNGVFITSEETSNVTAGLKMNDDGSYTRVAADAADANAVITGKFHSNDHGLQNFSATVAVEGTVKITIGACGWGSDVTVKDATGATVATVNTVITANTDCYHNNKEKNIVSTYYKVDQATTLTISGGGYVPYFAVEAVDPSEVPSDVTFTYSAGTEATGVAPASEIVGIGKSYTLPKNYTLYVEGKTLTGWTDGTNTYAPGETITAPDAEEVALTPVFTANEVSLADRTEPVTLVFDFQRKNGAPTVSWEGKTGIVWVTQATVNGKTIDVKTDVSTSPGKFANGNWTDWAQLNPGTTFSIPNYKGAKVSIYSFNATTTTTIDGQTDYTATDANTVTYDIANTAETIDIVIGDGSYFRYIQTVLPVPEKAFEPVTYDNETATINWPLNNSAADKIDAYTTTPEDAFSTIALNIGDLTVTGTGTRSSEPLADGVTFVKFKPAGSTQAVQWIAKPARGLEFTPTKITMWIQRFGTDAKDGVAVSAKVGENGESIALGTYTARRNNYDDAAEIKKWGSLPSNIANKVEITLTEAQQQALTSGEGLTLSATVGVGNTKEGGFSDVTIEGKLNGTTEDIAKYTLVAQSNDETAGSVSVYPAADEYEEGTEVRLTATEKFGYDFVNWTNVAGEELSTEPVFTLAMTADSTITANFVQVNTYELKLTVDGSNDYMVKINPAPTVVDGKYMYEEGTGVQLTAESYEGLVAFNSWSDGTTNSNQTISMTEDIELTANYADNDIIAGWDFYQAGASGRKADFADADNETATLNLVNTNDATDVQGWLDKSTVAAGGYESFKGAATNWRVGSSNGDVGNYHWQTKINAQNYTDINVQFQMMYNYNAYQTYIAEYSLDGEEWTSFGTITMTGTKAAASFSEALPAAANNQANVYIRMRADKSSNVDGSASQNDGNTLAMFFITGTAKIVDDGTAPILLSQVPADGAEGASATGKIVLTFDEKVKVADGTVAQLNGMKLTPVVSGKSVTFEYKGLEYSTSYEFTLPANTVADLTDNYLAEAVTINFTTMTRPTVAKQLYDFIVPDDGTFKEALTAAAARADKSKRFRIFVKKGDYVIPAGEKGYTDNNGNYYDYPDPRTYFNSPNVSIIGEDPATTSITNEMPNSLVANSDAGAGGQANPCEGIRSSGVLYLQSGATDTYFQDIKLWSNTSDNTGRNVVLVDGGNRTVCKNVTLWAYQDTYVPDNSQNLYYFEDGIIRGKTDFICGSGDVFFNCVNLIMCESGGWLSVPRDNVKYGFVYKDCTIDAGGASGVDGNYYLGRAWTAGAESYFIDTKMNVVPKGEGWSDWNTGPTRFAEYNSMTASGSPIDLSSRKKSFASSNTANSPVLTAEEALEIGNLHSMFGDWDPTLLTEQAPAAKNVVLDGDNLTWDDSNYALLYAIVKNGDVVAFTTENSFDISTVEEAVGAKASALSANGSVVWAVRTANEMGGLNEAVEATIATAVSEVEAAPVVKASNGKVYNVAGQEVSDSYKGIVIIDGKKIVK